jgi:hypothetical protein
VFGRRGVEAWDRGGCHGVSLGAYHVSVATKRQAAQWRQAVNVEDRQA